jgi:uncharacterized protein YbjT (DUF2867 family)
VRLAEEDRVRALRAEWTILRPMMIYGDSGDRNMERLIGFVSRSPIVSLPSGGRALVQPVHVVDLGRAAADTLLARRTARHESNLPGAEAAPLHEIVQHVGRLLGRRLLVLPLPIGAAARWVTLWQRLGFPPRLSAGQVLRLAEDEAFSFEDARRDWGYSPLGFREGFAAEVDALRAGRIGGG